MTDLAFNRAPVEDRRQDALPEAIEGTRGEVPILVRYLQVIKRRKWLMAGVMAIAAVLGLAVSLLMTPLYTADSTLEIQRENFNIVRVEGVEPKSSSIDVEFYQTQYGLLRSQSLAERVATSLRLADDPEFFRIFGADGIAEQIESQPTGRASAGERQERVRTAGSILLGRINVVPTRLSRLVDIQFTSPNAEFSARVVNAWTREFVQTSLERRFEATSYARRFLEQRLEQIRQRLEQSERQLVAYAARERIINIPSTTVANPDAPNGGVVERPLVAEDLATLNRELNEATAARVAAESRLRGSGGSSAEALQNQAISALRQRRAELAAEHARVLSQFEGDYPPARAIQSQIADLDRSIRREEGRVRDTLQLAYRSAAERERALQSRVQGLQRDLLDLRSRSIQYNIYQRDVDTNRQLYAGLLQRYREIGVAGGVGVNNVAVVDAAQVPSGPSSPNLILNVVLALFVGAAVAGGLAIALEQIDQTISDPSDVEPALGLPLLGTIPQSENATVEELDDRKSPMVEAYISAQTRLAFSTDHGVPRTLTVTSSRPGEGKTTTSYALALALARTDKRVVLVDADMRSPSLHHIFEVGNERGLSNFLSGGDDLDALIHRGSATGLDLLSAGPAPPNAAELLTSDRIDSLIAKLTAKYDQVIFDVPPVMGLADTPLIASKVEGVVFVIESHRTPVNAARIAIGRLRDARSRVLGALLTKFESRRAHYGYGYDYGYGYGEREGRSNQS